MLDEAYVEFQTDDDPDETLDLLAEFPNLVVLRTFSKCYGLAGLRVGYAIGSAGFRAAVDAVRQPFSVNALAQAAGAEAILHQDDVLRRVEATVAERLRVQEGAARSSACAAPSRRPTSPGSTSATPRRREVVAGARRARGGGAAGDAARRPRPHPRHLRAARPRTTASSPASSELLD